MYLDPPTLKEADQGLVLDSIYFHAIGTAGLGYVLTPTCDFAQSKNDYVQLCLAEEAEPFLREAVAGPWKNYATQAKLKERIDQLITQRFPRYHWLAPPPGRTAPLILDFQVVQSVPISQLNNAPIVAQLESPFREQVPARYAAYMARVGTPDFSSQQIDHWRNDLIKSLLP